MHGGAPGSGGPKGPRNGNYKHGRYTAEAIAWQRWLRRFTRKPGKVRHSLEVPHDDALHNDLPVGLRHLLNLLLCTIIAIAKGTNIGVDLDQIR
jgi:hypothetical protein